MKKWLLLCLVSLFLGLSFMPKNILNVFGTINEISQPLINRLGIKQIVLRKIIGHFGLNFLIVFCLSLSLTKRIKSNIQVLRVMIIFSILLGIAGEVLQIFSDGRVASLSDVMINVSGGLLASFCCYTIMKQRQEEAYL